LGIILEKGQFYSETYLIKVIRFFSPMNINWLANVWDHIPRITGMSHLNLVRIPRGLDSDSVTALELGVLETLALKGWQLSGALPKTRTYNYSSSALHSLHCFCRLSSPSFLPWLLSGTLSCPLIAVAIIASAAARAMSAATGPSEEVLPL
jgi:hypothetical protein